MRGHSLKQEGHFVAFDYTVKVNTDITSLELGELTTSCILHKMSTGYASLTKKVLVVFVIF